MNNCAEYNFRMEYQRNNLRKLIYEEPGYRLDVILEMSGTPKFDWIGVTQSFETWDVPNGQPVSSEKRQQILDRLADWSRTQNLHIDIAEGMSMEEILAQDEREGWSVVHNPDSTTTVTPPKGNFWS